MDSRTAELSNIEDWACYNNMKLNRSVKVMTKTKAAPFYLGHGVYVLC